MGNEQERDGAEPLFAERVSDLLSVDALKGLSGFEFIDGMRAGRLPAPPIARTLGFHLVEVEKGRVVFRGAPDFAYYNPIGGVHGGWFGTLLDSCMACAVQTMLKAGDGYTTLEYRVNIVRPVFEETEAILAVGEALHVGRRTGTAEGKMIGADSGKLYAFGTTTCLVTPL